MKVLTAILINKATTYAKELNSEFVTPEHLVDVALTTSEFRKMLDESKSNPNEDLDKIKESLDEYLKETALPSDKSVDPEPSDCLIAVLDYMDTSLSDVELTLRDIILQLSFGGSEVLADILEKYNFSSGVNGDNMDASFDESDEGEEVHTNRNARNTGGQIRPINLIPGMCPLLDAEYIKPENWELHRLYGNRLKELNNSVVFENKSMSLGTIYNFKGDYSDLAECAVEIDIMLRLEHVMELDLLHVVLNRQNEGTLGSLMFGIDAVLKDFREGVAGHDHFFIFLKNFNKAIDINKDMVENILLYLGKSNNGNSECIVGLADISKLSKELFRYYGVADMSLPSDKEISEAIIENSFSGFHDYQTVHDVLFETYGNTCGLYIDSLMADLHRKEDRLNNVSIVSLKVADALSDNTTYKEALERLSKKEESNLKLEDKLKRNVFGQDKAIDSVSKYIKIAQAGLGDKNKPVGSFLFVGPTGVGKTELAKQLADTLGYKLLKYDMSEYSESYTVSKMIGSPAGYVGYGDHTIVDDITSNPKSVVLMDEIEKAHPMIYNILLQIMDEAIVTDRQNRVGKFNDSILIMTSNAGAADSKKQGIGFGNDDFNKDGMKKAVSNTFTPEFIGRISSIVEFNALDKEMCRSIVNKELRLINDRLNNSREITLKWDTKVIDFITDSVDTKDSGARAINNYINNTVTSIISSYIVDNNIEKSEITLSVGEGGLDVR